MRGRIHWVIALVSLAVAVGCYSEQPDSAPLGNVQQGIGGAGGTSVGSGGSPGTINAIFQQRVFPSALYAGTTDTTLYHDNPTAAPGSDTYCIVKGGSHPKSCLLRFDISTIPSNATVQSAGLRLLIDDPSVSTFRAYALKRPWSQADATWTNATATQAWDAPGAAASTDRGTIAVGSFLGNPSHIVQLPLDAAIVQSWVASPQANYGIIFAAPVSVNDGVSFQTAEADDFPPELVVTYR